MDENIKPQAILGNEHLNHIIAVLIEQNDVLKKENEWLKIRIGLIEQGKSDPEIGMTFEAFWKSYPETRMGQTELLEPLPQIISPDGILLSALMTSLSNSGFRYVEKSTLRNAAALIIHFYNKGDGAYPELKKVTKLSTGGISKFMTSMRKRRLIQRYAYKKFELTPHGLNLLKQAYSKVKK